MTSVSAGHIILTPTQPVGSGRPQRESNPGPPDQESRALPTELPRPQVRDESVYHPLGVAYKKSHFTVQLVTSAAGLRFDNATGRRVTIQL